LCESIIPDDKGESLLPGFYLTIKLERIKMFGRVCLIDFLSGYILKRIIFGTFAVFLSLSHLTATEYYGHSRKDSKAGCSSCHKKQWKSWRTGRHSKAIFSLKAGTYKKEKIAAKLDPNKNYLKDKKCLKCHTTGYEQGGFEYKDKQKKKLLHGVGCESCHGAGGKYMKLKDEDDEYKRAQVVKLGLTFGEEKLCRKCHNDDSPFNEKVNPKYAFNYKKSVKEGTHEHFKLRYHKTRKGSEWLYK
jgi:hypothetical protein